MVKLYEKLLPGYAETSTKRHPKEPETIILDYNTIAQAYCLGAAYIDGNAGWLCFKVKGQRRYYFQFRPW